MKDPTPPPHYHHLLLVTPGSFRSLLLWWWLLFVLHPWCCYCFCPSSSRRRRRGSVSLTITATASTTATRSSHRRGRGGATWWSTLSLSLWSVDNRSNRSSSSSIIMTTPPPTTPPMLPGVQSSSFLSTAYPYELPVWARDAFTNPPRHGRLRLAHLPTPLYPITTLHHSTTSTTSTTSPSTSTTSSFGQILHDRSLTLFIKRDDTTGGIELGGNKIRKLEFLLADALSHDHHHHHDTGGGGGGGCDSVVTIGGHQSNHCRATAAACAMLGLQPHLILRCSSSSTTGTTSTTSTAGTTNNKEKPTTSITSTGDGKEVVAAEVANDDDEEDDPLGTVGNLLVDRLVGSHLYTVTTGEYGRIGSTQLVKRLCQHLRTVHGRTPYPIPVGGSNGLGSFGYLAAVDELMQQWHQLVPNSSNDGCYRTTIDHICLACGSGGTAAGVAVGMTLYHRYYYYQQQQQQPNPQQQQSPPPPPHVHAMGVCDDPDYFYAFVTSIVQEMGLIVPHDNNNNTDDSCVPTTITVADYVRSCLTVHQCKGQGYAVSTDDELQFLTDFAQLTGIVLDPVYTGKALYGLYQLLLQDKSDNNNNNDPSSSSSRWFRPGQRILFWHTGGALGLYDKCSDLRPILAQPQQQQHQSSPGGRRITKLDVYGNGGGGLDVSAPVE